MAERLSRNSSAEELWNAAVLAANAAVSEGKIGDGFDDDHITDMTQSPLESRINNAFAGSCGSEAVKALRALFAPAASSSGEDGGGATGGFGGDHPAIVLEGVEEVVGEGIDSFITLFEACAGDGKAKELDDWEELSQAIQAEIENPMNFFEPGVFSTA